MQVTEQASGQGVSSAIDNSKQGEEDVRRVIEEHWGPSKKTMFYEESPRGLIVASNGLTSEPEIVQFYGHPRFADPSIAKSRQPNATVVNVDCGIGRVNPTKLLIREVRRRHEVKSVRFRLLLSIGSGLDAGSARTPGIWPRGRILTQLWLSGKNFACGAKSVRFGSGYRPKSPKIDYFEVFSCIFR